MSSQSEPNTRRAAGWAGRLGLHEAFDPKDSTWIPVLDERGGLSNVLAIYYATEGPLWVRLYTAARLAGTVVKPRKARTSSGV